MMATLYPKHKLPFIISTVKLCIDGLYLFFITHSRRTAGITYFIKGIIKSAFVCVCPSNDSYMRTGLERILNIM
jgi:hypothetical protein